MTSPAHSHMVQPSPAWLELVTHWRRETGNGCSLTFSLGCNPTSPPDILLRDTFLGVTPGYLWWLIWVARQQMVTAGRFSAPQEQN